MRDVSRLEVCDGGGGKGGEFVEIEIVRVSLRLVAEDRGWEEREDVLCSAGEINAIQEDKEFFLCF